jgi:protein tyrosine phosphatase (PTP) superfamily phosphohydrolase (DUF442 family)
MKTLFASFLFACVFILMSHHPCMAQDENAISSPRFQAPYKIDAKYLPNAIQIHSKVISGGKPDGESAFRELQEMGVKTIVSVDGTKPEVALAKKYGLRYVHLPLGYNGISRERATELAKAVRDLDGSIYIHCHHGKHRSPAAATVACQSLGFLEPYASVKILTLAGTKEDYRGLFVAAASATRIDDSVLDAMQVDFPEFAKLSPLVETMVELDQLHDHLLRFTHATRSEQAAQADTDPAHDALLMHEHFQELLRSEGVASQPELFRRLLNESAKDAQSLESAIRQWHRSSEATSATLPKSLSEPLKRLSANCSACHRQFRD